MLFIKPRLLNDQEMAEVDEWLRQHKVDIVRFRRDFSDVYPLAVLLKPLYPRLINMIHYPKRNRISLKMENWETFNFKVLTKLNLSLSKPIFEQLAKGTFGAIELLILELLRAQERRRLAKERAAATDVSEETPREEKGVETLMVNKLEGDNIVQLPSKLVPYSRYERILRECQAKEALINMYQRRLADLEELVQAKAIRMEEFLTMDNNLPSADAQGQQEPEVLPEVLPEVQPEVLPVEQLVEQLENELEEQPQI